MENNAFLKSVLRFIFLYGFPSIIIPIAAQFTPQVLYQPPWSDPSFIADAPWRVLLCGGLICALWAFFFLHQTGLIMLAIFVLAGSALWHIAEISLMPGSLIALAISVALGLFIGISATKDLEKLKKDLNSSDWRERERAIYELNDFGSTPFGEDSFVKALEDEHADVRFAAAKCLLMSSGLKPKQIPIIINSQKGRNVSEDKDKFLPIEKIGPWAQIIIPDLIKMLCDNDPIIRGQTAMVLGKIGSDQEGLKALIKTLEDENQEVQGAAVVGLGLTGPMAKLAVPKLIEMLDIPETDIRGAVIETLGAIGSDAVSSVPYLIKCLVDEDDLIKEVSQNVLEKITGQTFGSSIHEWEQWWGKYKNKVKP